MPLSIFLFITHVDVNSMTIACIESSILLPNITVHYLPSLFFMDWGFLFFFSVSFFPLYCNLYPLVIPKKHTREIAFWTCEKLDIISQILCMLVMEHN